MEPRQIKIFAHQDVPRLRYIAGIILSDILGLKWDLTTDKRKIGKNPVINYSDENVRGAFRIPPDPLLFETGITVREIKVTEWKGIPVFFQTRPESDIPFDIFAASFFMVSRYEEYLEFQGDEHGRFMASSSLAKKNGFLHKPVVDLWTRQFAMVLLQKFPTLTYKRNYFRALLTIDVDEPFEYLGKSIFKSFGGLIRDFAVNKDQAGERYKVVKHAMKDPYEVFDYISERIEAEKPDVRFFFPTGDQSKFDHNPSWKNEEYRNLVRKISAKFTCGFHPSYFSSDNQVLLNDELSRFRKILLTEVVFSRFHYLRLFFPGSYASLAGAGISEDYSMGFHDDPGFRAGIARPFLYYDLKDERQTSLRIVPFQVMDATLFKYCKLCAAESEEIVFALVDETRKAGGLFVSIWHNTSLLETTGGREWRGLFEKMLKYQKS